MAQTNILNKAMMVKEIMQRLDEVQQESIENIIQFFDIPVYEADDLPMLIGYGQLSAWESIFTLKHRENTALGCANITIEVQISHTCRHRDIGNIVLNVIFPVVLSAEQQDWVQNDATLNLIQPPCCLLRHPLRHEREPESEGQSSSKYYTQKDFLHGFMDCFNGMDALYNEAQQCFNTHKNLFLEQIAIAQYKGSAIIVERSVVSAHKGFESLN